MLEDRTIELIHGWLDGSLDDAGFAELEATLAESAEARDRFWTEVRFHGELHQAIKAGFSTVAAVASRPATSWPMALGGALRRRAAWLVGAAALVAGGCGLGSVATSLSLAYAGLLPVRPQPVVVIEEDFESEPHPLHAALPRSPGYWSGDVTAVVGAENGVRPKRGRGMLRFDGTGPAGDSDASGSASEIWRLVDLAAVRRQLGITGDDTGLTLKLEASFNGVAPSEGRRPRCLVKAIATDAAWPASRSIWLQSGLTSARADDPSIVYVLAEESAWLDPDPASWQRMTITLHAPPTAGSLMLYCVMSDTTDAAGTSERRFEGQYVDAIRLRVTPSGETP